jgi:hypothetical protein
MADNEISLDRQSPVEAEIPAVAGKKKKDDARFPVLIEFTITLCAIILVIVFLTIVVMSFLTGATLLDFVIRTSISILILGSLLTLIARQISSGMLIGTAPEERMQSEELEIPNPPEVK